MEVQGPVRVGERCECVDLHVRVVGATSVPRLFTAVGVKRRCSHPLVPPASLACRSQKTSHTKEIRARSATHLPRLQKRSASAKKELRAARATPLPRRQIGRRLDKNPQGCDGGGAGGGEGEGVEPKDAGAAPAPPGRSVQEASLLMNS